MESDDRIDGLLVTLKQVTRAAASADENPAQGLAVALTAHLQCDVGSLSLLSKDVVQHRFADWDVALQHLADRS